MADVVWTPSERDEERSALGRLMRAHDLASYEELYRRSVDDLPWFWDATLRDLGVEWFRPYTQVMDTSRGLPWTEWFVGGQLNLTHNAVDKHAAGPLADRTALIYESEEGEVRRYTYRQLRHEVDRCAHALTTLGVGRGDRVGIFAPMIPETVFAALAVPKLGAIYVPIFSGYAAGAVAARLADCDAKLLITADGFRRRGKLVPMKETADAAADLAPTVERVLVARRAGRDDLPWNPKRDVWWDDAARGAPESVPTEAMNSEDPFMLIYTSGTTGRPKGCVHVHAGFPLKVAQDSAHCFDITPESTLYWHTDIGWMMGPKAIMGALILGATLVIYDGSPDHPEPDRLWALAARHGVTHLGVSPTFVRSVMGLGDELVRRHDLSRVRCFGSTGEPWNPEPWRWLFEVVGGGERPIMNYSGGTEISGGILGCTFLQGQKPTAFSGPVPGMDADVVDPEGNPVRGRVGELVLRRPWPGMTRGFWRDPERYLDTYWSAIPGLWVHGDWAEVDDDGYWYIRGRSDDTIKVAGKRVGPAEVESALVGHPAVREAAAIGAPDELKGESVVAFAILRPGHEPDDALREELRARVVAELGKPVQPKEVRFVADLPRTRNAKIMRRVVRAAYLGTDPGDLSALENPDAVEAIAGSR
jgi:acetyl-CoA synthetase